MKSFKTYLSILFFVFTISFAQTKMNIQKVDESALSAGESYPVDARPLLEAFDKANGINYEKAGKPVRLNKATAWNFVKGISTKSWMVSDLRKGTATPSYPMPSTCREVGDNCYIFVADSVWNTRVTEAVVQQVKEAFDLKTPANPNKGIFRTDVDTFGDPPDFDKDPRIIILIFDIKDNYSVTGTGGFTVGYFHGINQYPKSTYSNSNEAELFFMDANPLDWTKTTGLNTGLSTLAHEFQHMIHFRYIPSDENFFDESWSLAAEVICGYPLYTQSYYNGETNQYLLNWRSYDNTLVLNDYSRAAKFGLYLYEQYGASIFKNYLTNQIKGESGLNYYLQSLSPSSDLVTTLSNWWVANFLNDRSISPGFTKWGYNYSNIIKVTPKTIVNPNVTNASDAVYKLGAQYISYTSGKNLNINFNTLGNSSIKIKAIKTGASNKAVDDVPPGINYSVSDFGTTYNNVTFMVYHNNRNDFSQGTYAYSYTSSGTYQNKPIEIKYDDGDAKPALGAWDLSANDTIAVFFNGITGTRLDSIKVGLRNDKQITGYIYNTKNQGSRIWKPITSPFLLTGTSSPVKDPVTSLFPVPWPNMAKVDLRSQNIDASNPFAVSFVYTGTNSNSIVVVEHTPSEYFYSLTYLNNPSSSTPGWYYLSSSSTGVGLYLIRAYVSDFTTGVEKVIELMPTTFSLNQNYPNPFNPSTVINYQLPSASHVTLTVYDMLGREVTKLVDEYQQAGSHNSQFSILNSQFSSGIYFYTIRAGNFIETKKMVLMK